MNRCPAWWLSGRRGPGPCRRPRGWRRLAWPFRVQPDGRQRRADRPGRPGAAPPGPATPRPDSAAPTATPARPGCTAAPGSACPPGTAAGPRPAPRPTGIAGRARGRSPSGRSSPGRADVAGPSPRSRCGSSLITRRISSWRSAAVERRPQGQQLVERQAQRVDVARARRTSPRTARGPCTAPCRRCRRSGSGPRRRPPWPGRSRPPRRCPCGSSSRFDGLMSRWRTPWRLAYSSASATWRPIRATLRKKVRSGSDRASESAEAPGRLSRGSAGPGAGGRRAGRAGPTRWPPAWSRAGVPVVAPLGRREPPGEDRLGHFRRGR